MNTINVREFRTAGHPIADQFLERWSPRAMSGEPLAEETLLTIIEAARWAPSCANDQPWRFVYSLQGDTRWDAFCEMLTGNNRIWAPKAGALVVILSKTTFDRDGRPLPSHSFDAGAAWAHFALQGSLMNLVVHGMAGFDHEAARKLLGVPDEYAIEAMIAVGNPGDAAELPQHLREREKPSSRRPLSEIAFRGSFRNPND